MTISDISIKDKNSQISHLIDILSTKDRCNAFNSLQEKSKTDASVYPYWDVFTELLKSENAFERSIGIHLIAVNTKWDTQNKFDVDLYLKMCDDISLVVSRACIQNLEKILKNKNYDMQICKRIKEKFNSLDVDLRPITHRNVLKKDMAAILKLINN